MHTRTVQGGGAREGCTGGQGRVYWWSGEGVQVVRGGCEGGQFKGVLVVRGGCEGGQGRVYVTRHNGYYNSRSLCKIYGKGIMNCSPLMIAPLLRPYYISIC